MGMLLHLRKGRALVFRSGIAESSKTVVIDVPCDPPLTLVALSQDCKDNKDLFHDGPMGERRASLGLEMRIMRAAGVSSARREPWSL